MFLIMKKINTNVENSSNTLKYRTWREGGREGGRDKTGNT